MASPEQRLQAFQHLLRGWQPFMTRATRGVVEFTTKTGGEFAITVKWKNRDGSEGSFTREYTREFCFGRTFSLPPSAWVVEKRPCDHARDLVRCVLGARGVL